MKGGDWGPAMPEKGYKSLTVARNIFSSNVNSFVSQSLSMTGNTFSNKANQNLRVAAYVLGYSGR